MQSNITLEYKMEKGERLEYSTNVHSEQTFKEAGKDPISQAADTYILMDQIAKAVNPDGSINVDVMIKDGKTKAGKEEFPLPTIGQTINMKMQKNGKITGSSVDMPFNQPPFPEKALNQGDTWTGDSQINVPNRPEPLIMHYNYTLKGFTSLNGYEFAEVSVSCPKTEIDLQDDVKQIISAEGTTYFAYQEGRLIKSQVNTKTNITAEGMEVNSNISITIELQKTESASSVTPFGESGFIIN